MGIVDFLGIKAQWMDVVVRFVSWATLEAARGDGFGGEGTGLVDTCAEGKNSKAYP